MSGTDIGHDLSRSFEVMTVAALAGRVHPLERSGFRHLAVFQFYGTVDSTL